MLFADKPKVSLVRSIHQPKLRMVKCVFVFDGVVAVVHVFDRAITVTTEEHQERIAGGGVVSPRQHRLVIIGNPL